MKLFLTVCLFCSVTLIGVVGLGAMAPQGLTPTASPGTAPTGTVYACPMHPDVHATIPGACPRCGMKLVLGAPASNDRFALELLTEPSTPRPGQPLSMRFTVRQGSSANVVRAFTEMHERLFHLFVVSEDLEYFDHIHPLLQPDGSLRVETALPRSGRYQLYADFVPQGGTPQFIARTLYVAGATADPGQSRPPLIPNDAPQRVGDSIVELQLPPGEGLIAGELQAFRIHLKDLQSGAPVTDLEPYLGAPAHLLIVSDDLVDGQHSHPALNYSSTNGPDVVFETVFPRSAIYRIWFQFQRHGRLGLASFTVSASLPPSVR